MEFILIGLTHDPELQPLIFSLFLTMYLVTVPGNLLIIMVVTSDPHLHTAMYFFLSSLSTNDICLNTNTVPKMFTNILTQDQSLTYTVCLTQAWFMLVFIGLENSLLAVMAYEHYVAIYPLRYCIIMNPCWFSLFISFVFDILHILMVLHLSFCKDLEIPHFFCELAWLIKIACSDTLINNILAYLVCCVFGGIPISGIIFSYAHIRSTLLSMQSLGRKYKAFSTCGSHLLVITLFYGTILGVYISSAVTDSPKKAVVASVIYCVVPQMLNPFIYHLRNKDMKEALRKLIRRVSS
uniref:Olfactory receptor family 7 subfamily G member 35 n=1 Tax=Nannospalax galili TaxID=1026970 RepID=A0A8C6QCK9_NANGA